MTSPGSTAQQVATDFADFLHPVFQNLPLAIFLVATDGAIVLANGEAERLFQYSGPELIGLSVDVLVPDAFRARHAELRQQFFVQSVPSRMAAGRELLGRRKDGSELPIEVSLAPVHVHDTPFVIASVVDVTERRHQQDAWRLAHDTQLRFETLVGETAAGFIGLRPDELGRALEDTIGRVVRMLELDRGTLFQISADTGEFLFSYQWTRPGCEPAPARVVAREVFPWFFSQLSAGEIVVFSQLEDIPDARDRVGLHRFGAQSGVTIPISVGGRLWGAVSFTAVRTPHTWTPALIGRMRLVAFIFASALNRQRLDDALGRSMTDAIAQRDRLREENAYLRHELHGLTRAPALVGHSAAFRRVLEQVRQAAATDTPVLLVGELGTGKSLLAARIHDLSSRSDRVMVRINCAALSPAAIERELLGADDESGPGALRHSGRLELAHQSTLFFDEVSSLPLETQATLSRLLLERTAHGPGAASRPRIDVRVIAATRHDLRQLVAAGRFRSDLFRQLNGISIQVPALRDRPEDIPLLVWRFVDELADAHGKSIDAIDERSIDSLRRYAWPGNAREVRTVVEEALIVSSGRLLHISPPSSPSTRMASKRIRPGVRRPKRPTRS